MLLLLKYWQFLAGVAITAVIAWVLHSLVSGWSEARHQAALDAQEEALYSECAADKQITTEVSNEYQSQLVDLRRQLDAAKRLRPSVRVPVTSTPGGRDAGAGDTQLPHADGVAAADLLDFAYDAEQVGRQLDACQGFIRRVRK